MPATQRRVPAIVKATPAQLARYFEAKLAAEVGPFNVKRLLDAHERDTVVLDVRSREGYGEGHVPEATHIPFEELPIRMKELPKAKTVIIYCWDTTCTLAAKAAYMLAKQGYRAREMVGGIEAWHKAGFPIEK